MPHQQWKNRDTRPFEVEPGASAERYDPVLETRLTAMRTLLTRTRPGSHAEALQALRAAFPDASLSERVAVLAADADGRA